MQQQLFHKRFIMSEQLMSPIGDCYMASGKNNWVVANTSDSDNKRTEYICNGA